MTKFSHRLSHIKTLDCYDIVDLHFEIQEAIKTAYRSRADPKHLALAIELCEESISISDDVMEAMKEKHRAQAREYKELLGKEPPNHKFYYPGHHAQRQLGIILRRNGETEKENLINQKMEAEGWGSCREEDV
ncbi:hypothetical protein [Scandinavium manionii]|uniref:hypothetical protein n=1 Tax=Scandinavium manionii TaxID=2926520 RepID=UPI0021655464|nr:hypothetical protein [Scandinavium manionii]MCS2167539.1 hypothetical protein [Scandinavium manionii]